MSADLPERRCRAAGDLGVNVEKLDRPYRPARSRSATRTVNSPSCVPRSSSRAPGRAGSMRRIARRFSSSVAQNTRRR